MAGLQAYHVFILGTHDHWVTVAVAVLPKGTEALPRLWVLESENKQMLRDAKPDSKRAKVMRVRVNATRMPARPVAPRQTS